MKKFLDLGKSLSKEEQKKVIGGVYGDDDDYAGCSDIYMGCNYNGHLTCDYHVTCPDGRVRDLCGYQCREGDGGDCSPQ